MSTLCAREVSILARPFERALPRIKRLCYRRIVCFNPRPPFRAGATRGRPKKETLDAFQSSPALSSGRYQGLSSFTSPRICFNPRPPFRAGATANASASILVFIPVSILARPFERALLSHHFQYGRGGEFQSSPALSSGRYFFVRIDPAQLSRFQSSPALSSGRYAGWHGARRPVHCFNPRPPFRAGATNQGGVAVAG